MHLELRIEHEQFEGMLRSFKDIAALPTPTEKISCVMTGIEELYNIMGRDKGQDIMLPSIIYCLLKSATINIHSEVQFMIAYRRKGLGRCREGCDHGLGVRSECSCFKERMYDEKEAMYYLTSMQAAIDFIKKMEYYDLKIDKMEFDMKITSAMESMRKK